MHIWGHPIAGKRRNIWGFIVWQSLGVTEEGNQPMTYPEDDSLILVCNGEIYNYLELAERYGFKLKTGSDSEFILFLFKKIWDIANSRRIGWSIFVRYT